MKDAYYRHGTLTAAQTPTFVCRFRFTRNLVLQSASLVHPMQVYARPLHETLFKGCSNPRLGVSVIARHGIADLLDP